jgi:hypothetical protein
MHVAFCDVWKTSLFRSAGGQLEAQPGQVNATNFFAPRGRRRDVAAAAPIATASSVDEREPARLLRNPDFRHRPGRMGNVGDEEHFELLPAYLLARAEGEHRA